MRRKILLGLISVLALGLMATAAPAFAQEWLPINKGVSLSSDNIELELAPSVVLECSDVTAWTNTGEGSLMGFTPDFNSSCTAPIKDVAEWDAVADDAGSAELAIPENGGVIEDGPCTITLEESVVPGTWATGNPSTWTLSGPVAVKIEGATCGLDPITWAQARGTVLATGENGAEIEP